MGVGDTMGIQPAKMGYQWLMMFFFGISMVNGVFENDVFLFFFLTNQISDFDGSASQP